MEVGSFRDICDTSKVGASILLHVIPILDLFIIYFNVFHCVRYLSNHIHDTRHARGYAMYAFSVHDGELFKPFILLGLFLRDNVTNGLCILHFFQCDTCTLKMSNMVSVLFHCAILVSQPIEAWHVASGLTS